MQDKICLLKLKKQRPYAILYIYIRLLKREKQPAPGRVKRRNKNIEKGENSDKSRVFRQVKIKMKLGIVVN